jgi:diguanylate cyclase (GGDEF)-like protein
MTESDLQAQQLVELLQVMSSYTDESAATRAAVDQAVRVLDAEVAAVLRNGRVVRSVGFAAGREPYDELARVASGELRTIRVPGAGDCDAITVTLDGAGNLVLARGDAFSAAERNLLRGMGRILDLTMKMIRTVDSLRQGQQLMEQLYGIQRAISRRTPLLDVLHMIVEAAGQLLGDEIVGLWRLDSTDPHSTLLVASLGLGQEQSKRLWRMPLAEGGAVGRAVLTDDVASAVGYADGGEVLRELTACALRRSMAIPVHENGKIAGALLVASCRSDLAYGQTDRGTMLAFAEHVSLALTDAKTLDEMQQAYHDSLTGLASRPLFLDRLQEALGVSRRDEALALLFVDLDKFKVVNDTLGHAAGDLLLIEVAERLRANLRVTDVAARFGGDEFAVMLQGVTAPGQATEIAGRIIHAMSEPFEIAGRQVFIGASVGISMSPGGRPPADLVREADLAMYQAKRLGRGRFEVFDPVMEDEFSNRAVGGDLWRALDQLVDSP